MEGLLFPIGQGAKGRGAGVLVADGLRDVRAGIGVGDRGGIEAEGTGRGAVFLKTRNRGRFDRPHRVACSFQMVATS